MKPAVVTRGGVWRTRGRSFLALCAPRTGGAGGASSGGSNFCSCVCWPGDVVPRVSRHNRGRNCSSSSLLVILFNIFIVVIFEWVGGLRGCAGPGALPLKRGQRACVWRCGQSKRGRGRSFLLLGFWWNQGKPRWVFRFMGATEQRDTQTVMEEGGSHRGKPQNTSICVGGNKKAGEQVIMSTFKVKFSYLPGECDLCWGLGGITGFWCSSVNPKKINDKNACLSFSKFMFCTCSLPAGGPFDAWDIRNRGAGRGGGVRSEILLGAGTGRLTSSTRLSRVDGWSPLDVGLLGVSSSCFPSSSSSSSLSSKGLGGEEGRDSSSVASLPFISCASPEESSLIESLVDVSGFVTVGGVCSWSLSEGTLTVLGSVLAGWSAAGRLLRSGRPFWLVKACLGWWCVQINAPESFPL